jgi:FixJ family two-component response regulator
LQALPRRTQHGDVQSGRKVGLTPLITIVDDDFSVCRCLERMARQAGWDARSFSSAEAYLASGPGAELQPSCLVVDLKLPGLSGLDLQRERDGIPACCPTIFVSGCGDIPAAVMAMKQGALTFLTKPFDRDDVVRAMAEAIQRSRKMLESSCQSDALRKRIEGMTSREREVMGWVIAGALNKQIAGQLGIVEQTVKVHRARVMEKMRASSVADLVRLCDAAGFEMAAS